MLNRSGWTNMLVTAGLLLSATAASAQPSVRVLIPVAIEDHVIGAYGSDWETDFVVTNTGGKAAALAGVRSGCVVVCEGYFASVAPGATVHARPFPVAPNSAGHFILVEPDAIQNLHMALRVHDTSRALQTWGTVIPVVREDEAFVHPFELLDVPADARSFRSLLRIYGFSHDVPMSVTVRVFRSSTSGAAPQDVPSDDLVTEKTFTLSTSVYTQRPVYAEWMLDGFDRQVAADRVRVEIVPNSSTTPVWAFISVTNNETQHVTVIAPE